MTAITGSTDGSPARLAATQAGMYRSTGPYTGTAVWLASQARLLREAGIRPARTSCHGPSPTGAFTRRGVGAVEERTPVGETLRLLDAQGFGPVLVLNQAGVVMGAAYRDALRSTPGDAETGSVMRFGVSTVRPSGMPPRSRTGWAMPG
jgi:hypothetical protein